MSPTDASASPQPPAETGLRPTGRLRGVLAGTRALIRIAYRDPEHVAERLTLYASEGLAASSRDWAEQARRARPDTSRAELAEELRLQSAKLARIDGAAAGTPFLVALLPGYMGYLWQEARMGLRTAALYGRDPGALSTAADMLVMRGVHPTSDAAEAALAEVVNAPLPAKPSQRRSLGTWVHSVQLLLIFGGFLSAPGNDVDRIDRRHPRLRAAGGFALGTATWAVTWVFPVTFMIAMAWTCESHTRTLGSRMLAFYDPGAGAITRRDDARSGKRAALASAAIGLSVAVPIVFVGYADSVHKSTGFSWLTALGALVALSLVLAVTVSVSRR